MRLIALTVLTAVSAPALATPSSLTGLDVIVNIAKARGVVVDSFMQNLIQRHPGVFLNTSNAGVLARDLRVSPQVLSALVMSAGTPVSAELATQAVMQSVSGKELLLDAIQKLLEQNPGLLVINIGSFRVVITNAALLAELNAIVAEARKPVTARGGRK